MIAALMNLREQERSLLDQLETVQLNIRRQEGAVMYIQAKMQQAQTATNGVPAAAPEAQ